MSVTVPNDGNSESTTSQLSRPCLAAALAALALVLSWLVVSRTVVACLERFDPEWALAIRVSDANAELELVNNWVAKSAKADGRIPKPNLETNEAKQHLLRVLNAEPLNASAFELLGILSAASEDTVAATRFMQAAEARSLRRPAAHDWLMRQSLAAKDIESAINHANALLRIRPDLISGVAPALSQIAAMPGGTEALIATLSTAPPWREKFFRAVNGATSNVDAPAKLLLGLLPSEHPPTPKEINAYLRYLIDEKKYELAYSSWLQLLPPSQLRSAGPLFNGNFQFAPSGLPFDWTIERSDRALAEIIAAQGLTDQNALSVELGGGRVDFRPIYQFLQLAPGRYRLLGNSKGNLKGLRGLKWQIACLEQLARPRGESPAFLDGSSAWAEFSVRFDIPASCRAQIIRLILDARSASETLVAGSFAFTSLKIERDGD